MHRRVGLSVASTPNKKEPSKVRQPRGAAKHPKRLLFSLPSFLHRGGYGGTLTKCLVVFISLVLLRWLYWFMRLTRYDFNQYFGIEYAPVLPWNPHYRVEEAHERLGDRSDRYAFLRKEFDEYLNDPVTFAEQLSLVNSRKVNYRARPMESTSDESDQAVYDIHNCPPEPPKGYPFVWKTMDIINAWNPNELTAPASLDPDTDELRPLLYQSLCVFDFTKDYEKAKTYRDASLPFLMTNDPSVTKTTVRWSLPNYLSQMFGDRDHWTYFSENNHFMFYTPISNQQRMRGSKFNDQTPDGWKEPTKDLWMPYDTFVSHANVSNDRAGPGHPHYYLRSKACGFQSNDGSCAYDETELFFDELPFLQPVSTRPSNNLYMYKPEAYSSGIICRFGMPGIIYESHFDRNGNTLAMLTGSRRFILSPPSQCKNQALFPYGHPSARHSQVDWSNPDLEQFPQFAKSMSTEFVLQAGQTLYLPSNWFHFIVSLDMNAQCNSWSSNSVHEHLKHIEECGF